MELKIEILILILVILFHQVTGYSNEEEQVFVNYLNKFKIRIGRKVGDMEGVKGNIISRYRMVKKHNEKFVNGNETFQLELNKFSYLSNQELGQRAMGIDVNGASYDSGAIKVPKIATTNRTSRSTPLPAYFNWNDLGIVRPVQDQRLCNSCYAFAAIAAIEAAACKNLGQCQKLSEQEAMECTGLCVGGWDDWIYSYSVNANGCTSSSYAYSGYKRQECSSARSRKRIENTKVKGWYLLPNDEETMRNYLYQVGPIFVVFNAYENFFSYKSGIYSAVEGDYLGVHAVLITGYGSENGVDYWILKNSYGLEYGENGYFRMKRGVNLCNIEGWKATIPVVN